MSPAQARTWAYKIAEDAAPLWREKYPQKYEWWKKAMESGDYGVAWEAAGAVGHAVDAVWHAAEAAKYVAGASRKVADQKYAEWGLQILEGK